MECSKAHFWQFFSTNVKICLYGRPLDTRHQIHTFHGFYSNSLISQDPKFYVVRQLVKQFVPIHLYWNEIKVRREKVYKYLTKIVVHQKYPLNPNIDWKNREHIVSESLKRILTKTWNSIPHHTKTSQNTDTLELL